MYKINLLFILTLAFCSFIKAEAQQKVYNYSKKEIMIPMRDGIKLFTRIYVPDTEDSLPILMMRSPYSDWNIGVINPADDPYVQNMAREGYIFVYQNIRGKQGSEGKFVMQKPVIAGKNNIDESTDTYDAIEWILKNIPHNNGKVGQLGISYPGWTAMVSAAYPHPALKAASPQATMSDLYLGDDFHHNGAFRYSYGFEYAFEEEAARGDTSFPFPQYDLFDWYLKVGSLKHINENYFHGGIPSWNDFVNHPDYDQYWKIKSPLNYISKTVIPTLHVGGYWDQEDIMGPQLLYTTLEKKDLNHLNYIVLGPWYHGQWSESIVDHIGNYQMGRNTAAEFRELQKKWFDYWLKGIGNGHFDEATAYQTGSNNWKTYSSWPPSKAQKKALYLTDNGKLSFSKPSGTFGYTEYISDPANPVPYRSRPIEETYGPGSRWHTWLTEDQRFVNNRPDVAMWESDTLNQDLTITGSIIAHLFASTSGTDADWVVKLIDVYPNLYHENLQMSQYELMIASEIFRGRYRSDFTHPVALIPNKPEEFIINLHQVNHVFKKGHRLLVQIQSSWFPIIDRNPQKFVLNIFEAKDADFIKATQRIYSNNKYATYIELPVMSE